MPTGSKDHEDDFNEALMMVIRAKMGVRQMRTADLARVTDIPRSTLSRIVNGQRLPDLKQVRLISDALGVSMARLMTEADDVLKGDKHPGV
jgi:transcriptional regulator with XRE-family HTH domain